MKTIEDLANLIRTIDGDNTMGAGELAEKVSEHFALVPLGDVPEALKAIDDLEKLATDGMVADVLAHYLRALLAKATEGKDG